MGNNFKESRRFFLKTTCFTAGIAASGLSFSSLVIAKNQPDLEFNLLTIHPDNSITVYNSRSEMGQGVSTSLTQLLLDELDADWSQIKEVKNSWADNKRFGHQNTIGAISSLIGWNHHRQAGGTINLLLRETAAKIWQINVDKVSTHKGVVHNNVTKQSLTYGQLTNVVNTEKLSDKIELKAASKFTLIGKSLPRVDLVDKITGKAKFGIDQVPDNVKIATVARCPVFGGKLISFDDLKARNIDGVIDIFAVPSGVVIIADNYWQATKAQHLLDVEWDYGEFKHQSDDLLQQTFKAQLASEGNILTDEGDIKTAFDKSEHKISADYSFPFVAHMTMEPMNCCVRFHKGRCDIWAPTQNPNDAKLAAAKTLNIDEVNVNVNVTFIGGGFGRRAQDDFIKEACEIAKHINAPIKVIWSREDDLKHGYYRPTNRQRIQASLFNGKINGWLHKVATLATSPYHFSSRDRHKDSGNWIAYGGSEKSLYRIDNFQTQVHFTETPMPVGILRGISHGYINFACETVIDELAQMANKDPIEFRKQHLSEQRALDVLTLLKTKLASISLNESQFVGVAFGNEKAPQGPYQYYNAVAAVIEKSSQGIKVVKVIMALDHGQVINPDGLLAQAQGSTMFALSMMFHQNLTLKSGQIQQSNFHDCPVARIGDAVDVEIHTISHNEWPMGVGEKLQGTIQPAIINALYRATGNRIRNIPIDLSSLEGQI